MASTEHSVSTECEALLQPKETSSPPRPVPKHVTEQDERRAAGRRAEHADTSAQGGADGGDAGRGDGADGEGGGAKQQAGQAAQSGAVGGDAERGEPDAEAAVAPDRAEALADARMAAADDAVDDVCLTGAAQGGADGGDAGRGGAAPMLCEATEGRCTWRRRLTRPVAFR
jgi:hypothetical protein